MTDELEWDCIMEIGKFIDKWYRKTSIDLSKPSRGQTDLVWSLAKAELANEVYVIIKKYKEKDETQRL